MLSYNNKMRILHYAKKMFAKCDLFSTSQFLRYQEQADYKTASGGICSLLVVGVFIGLFMNIAIQTANMQIINWSSTNESTFIPQPTTVTVDPKDNHFMFGLTIMGIDLNDVSQRFFDIYLVEHHFIQTAQVLPPQKIPMVPCTKQHFNINSQISQSYVPLKADKWLCPPLGYNYTIQGKWTSETFRTLQVYIGKCYNSTEPSRPCVSDTVINQYMAMRGQFFVGYVYANPIINPGDSNYLNHYLDDRNFIRFTTKLGAMNIGYVQDYSIITDVSLMPYSQNTENDGIIIPELFQNIVYQVTQDVYASFFLMKASSSVTYQRSFNKIDSFFSYVGGLIGTILGFMLFMNTFTEMAFELDISQRLFKHMNDDPNSLTNFNLLTYCRFLVYQFLSLFGLCKGWLEMVKYDDCKEEMVKQLDIQLLIHKINFLQRATEVLFEDNQLYGLHLQQFDSLLKLRRRRKLYAMRKRISSQQINKNQINETESQDKSRSDESDRYSESEKPVDNNTAINITMDMRNGMLNSNIDSLIVEDTKDLPSLNKHRDRAKKKDRREQLQRLQREMEEGNAVSKRIFEGIDPMYLQGFSKDQSPHNIFKNTMGSEFELVQVRKKQEDIGNREKIDFEFITD